MALIFFQNRPQDLLLDLCEGLRHPNKQFLIVHGHYEFVVLAFGLKNTPFMFMCFMNSFFHKHLGRFVMATY
jgi:hypothetical protein